MPPLWKQRLPYLKANEVLKVIQHCENPRDKAIILLMADTGIRQNGPVDHALKKIGVFRNEMTDVYR